LAFVIGIEGDVNVTPKSVDLSEFAMLTLELNNIEIESKILSFNPDWKTLENSLTMQEENIKISKGDYHPTVALIGSLGFMDNNKDTGNVYNIDERNYTVGLVMEIPIFNGFITKKKIAEKRLEMQALNSQSLLVKEAIKMKVVNLLNQMLSLSPMK
jgi:outer membrane protein